MIKIVEVGARDGLQNEKLTLSPKIRFQLIEKLEQSGLKKIEMGAFVSPKWVPQMANSEMVAKFLFEKYSGKKKHYFSALVPNSIGMERAISAGLKEVAIFGACSESFSRKNINCSIKQSFDRFSSVVSMAETKKIRVRGYLSTAFGCPYEGKVSAKKVVGLTKQMLNLGIYEVSIGDTIGVATPRQVSELLQLLKGEDLIDKVAMHFHNTRGTALANVSESLRFGVSTFDSSIGGLGGCPYAKGASGNLATEDLVYLLEGMQLRTGVNMVDLISITKWIEKKIGRDLPAMVSKAGMPLSGTL